jgi:hypothetical protein
MCAGQTLPTNLLHDGILRSMALITHGRHPGVLIRLLVTTAGILLLAETCYIVRNVAAMVHMNEMLSQSAIDENTLTEAMRGVLMLIAANLCFTRCRNVADNGAIPASLVLPYGAWLAWTYGHFMGTKGPMHGDLNDDVFLGFLGGIGLMLVSLLILGARWASASQRRARLHAFRS